MSLYAAIDLHSNSSLLAIIDENDVLHLRRGLPKDIEAIPDNLYCRDRQAPSSVSCRPSSKPLKVGLRLRARP
jgi:hypothetical protein